MVQIIEKDVILELLTSLNTVYLYFDFFSPSKELDCFFQEKSNAFHLPHEYHTVRPYTMCVESVYHCSQTCYCNAIQCYFNAIKNTLQGLVADQNLHSERDILYK